MPWAIANASFKKQKRNQGVTEIVEIPGPRALAHDRQRLARGRRHRPRLRTTLHHELIRTRPWLKRRVGCLTSGPTTSRRWSTTRSRSPSDGSRQPRSSRPPPSAPSPANSQRSSAIPPASSSRCGSSTGSHARRIQQWPRGSWRDLQRGRRWFPRLGRPDAAAGRRAGRPVRPADRGAARRRRLRQLVGHLVVDAHDRPWPSTSPRPRRDGFRLNSTCSARPCSASTRPAAGSTARARCSPATRRRLRLDQGLLGRRASSRRGPSTRPSTRSSSGSRRSIERRRATARRRRSSTSTWRSTATST